MRKIAVLGDRIEEVGLHMAMKEQLEAEGAGGTRNAGTAERAKLKSDAAEPGTFVAPHLSAHNTNLALEMDDLRRHGNDEAILSCFADAPWYFF